MTCCDCGSNTPALVGIAGQALPNAVGSTSPIMVPWQNPPGTAACVPAHKNLSEFLEWFYKTVTPYLCVALTLKDNPCSVVTSSGGAYVVKTINDVVTDCIGALAGGAETPLTVTDSLTVNLTPGASGNGHTGLVAEVKIATTAGNTLTVGADGLYVAPPTCAQIKTALEGTGCLTVGAVAEVVGFDVQGKLIKGVGAGAAAETPLTVAVDNGILLTPGGTGNGHTGLKASLVVSPDANNIITVTPNGVYVPAPTCAQVKAALTETGCLTAGTLASAIGLNAAGQLVTGALETELTVTDSATIDLTPGATGNGHTGLTASVKISADTGNNLVAKTDGLFVPDPTCAQVKAALESTGCIVAGTVATFIGLDAAGKVVSGAAAAETALTVTDSTTVNLTPGATGNGHTGLTASVIVSPDAGNRLVASANGLLVPAIACADILPLFEYQGANSCFPDKLPEKATIVLSVDSATGEIAWRNPPDLDCDLLEKFLLPNPESAVGCYPKTAGAPSRVLGFIDGSAALGWFETPTCAQVKAALESTNCIAAGTVATVLAFDAAGKLIKGTIAAAAETALTVTDSTTVNLTPGATGNGHTGLTAEVIISPDTGNLLVANANGLYVAPPTCAQILAILKSTACIPLLAAPSSLELYLNNEVDSVFGVHFDGTVKRQQRRWTAIMWAQGDAPKSLSDTAANIATTKVIHDWKAFAGSDTRGDIKVVDVATPTTNKAAGGLFQAYKSNHGGVYNVNVNSNLEFSALPADLLTTGPETYKVANRSWYVITEMVMVKSGVTTTWLVGKEEIPLTAVVNRELVKVGVNAQVGPLTLANGDYVYVRSYIEGANAASDATPVKLTIPNNADPRNSFGITEIPISTF